jgi:hypothetical protein
VFTTVQAAEVTKEHEHDGTVGPEVTEVMLCSFRIGKGER